MCSITMVYINWVGLGTNEKMVSFMSKNFQNNYITIRSDTKLEKRELQELANYVQFSCPDTSESKDIN